MARRGSVLVVAVTLLAACASDGEASPVSSATTPAVVATSTAPTTTNAPTTTSTPTTTIDPAVTLAAEVEADLLESFRLANEALQDPFDSDKESAALEGRIGFASEALRARLADYRSHNLAIRLSGVAVASMTVEVPASLVEEGADVAELQTCEVDPWLLVEVGAGPNGSDAIVDSTLSSYRSAVFLRNVDGVWLVEGGTELGLWEGVSECPS